MITFSDYVWDAIFNNIGKYKNNYLLYDGKKWNLKDYYSGKTLFHSKDLNGLLPIIDFEILKTSYQFETLYFQSEDDNIKTMALFYNEQSPTYYANYMAKTVLSYIVAEAS